jgi:small multidrug resistance pump
MSHWTCLAIAIVAEVIGTSFLKSSEGFTKLLPSAIVVVTYVIAFYFLGLTLKTLPVGIAYAVWAGAGVALITLVGYLFFGQALDAPALIGIVLIALGVAVINLFSASVRHGGSQEHREALRPRQARSTAACHARVAPTACACSRLLGVMPSASRQAKATARGSLAPSQPALRLACEEPRISPLRRHHLTISSDLTQRYRPATP